MTSSRKLRMEDILENNNDNNKNKNDIHTTINQIPKNQEVFGHKKRIKP